MEPAWPPPLEVVPITIVTRQLYSYFASRAPCHIVTCTVKENERKRGLGYIILSASIISEMRD